MKKDEYDLKLEYKKLKEEYELPEYEKLSQDFDIEKLSENESDYLMRNIRRVIGEKLSAYMHFFEILLNPRSPPLFIYPIIKILNKELSEKINKVYKELSKFQMKSMKLDTIYSKKLEAEFINKIFKEWQKIKKEVYELIEEFEKSLEKIEEEKKSGYFG